MTVFREKKPRRQLAVLDCETDPFVRAHDATGKPIIPRPFIWGFFDGETHRDFPSIERFLQWLVGCGKRFIVYAHNGGKFDFHFMLPCIPAYQDLLIINGRLARFTIGDNEFRDSWCILPVPLSAYAKEYFDYRKMRASVRDKHMVEIRRYLKSDCENLFALVKGFADSYGKGKEGTQKLPAITLAGTALNYWEALTGLSVPITDKVYYDRIRPYYYGGRVECFRTGLINKRFHVFDINSAYPRAMLEQHPFSDTYETVIKPSGRDPIRMQSMYKIVGVSEGALPMRADDGSLNFPSDGVAREYTVTGWEVAAGLETKTLRVLEWMERRDWTGFVDFKQYVGHFYKLKAEAKEKGDKVGYLLSKLFQNGLYGKFSACPEAYDNFAIAPPDLDDLAELDNVTIGRHRGPWRHAGELGPWLLLSNRLAPPRAVIGDDGNVEYEVVDARYNAEDQASKVKSDYYNVATGASITGFVRATIWRAVCAVRAAGGVVLYCDTDSIVCHLPEAARPGGKACPFTISKAIGDWSHEGEYVRGGIAGKKLYAFQADDAEAMTAHNTLRLMINKPDDMTVAEWEALGDLADKAWKTAAKGVRLDPETILEVAAGGTVSYVPPPPTFGCGREPVYTHRTIVGTSKGRARVGRVQRGKSGRNGRKVVAK